MKILVMSDSHYDVQSVKLVEKYLKDTDIIIHCGDGAPDTELLMNYFKGEVYAVRGNCDFSKKYPKEMIIDVLGVKIFITHGDLYNVKYEYNTIFFKAKELGADIVTFGHSHRAIIEEYNGITIMNPGSVSLPYDRSNKTIAFIEIKNNKKYDIYLQKI
ncbi:metallophosphoesterase [Clostridium isatidis]|uniref:metallophosphoesterase n=1 Tax=Clostridium isatidis TaxID=182773 RepID=UPI003AAB772A